MGAHLGDGGNGDSALGLEEGGGVCAEGNHICGNVFELVDAVGEDFLDVFEAERQGLSEEVALYLVGDSDLP